MTGSEDLAARIGEVEGDIGAGRTPGQATATEQPEAGPSGAAPSPPPLQDLAEVEAFLTEGALWVIETGFGARARQAGPHWNLTDPEKDKLTPPVSRLAAKWAPRVAAFIPGVLVRFKEEAALCMVLASMIYARAKVDQQLAAEAAAAQPKGAMDGGQEGTQGQ